MNPAKLLQKKEVGCFRSGFQKANHSQIISTYLTHEPTVCMYIFEVAPHVYICKYTHTYEKSNTPFSYMLWLLGRKAYREL